MTPPVLVASYEAVGTGSVSVSVPSVQSGDFLVEVLGNSYATADPVLSGSGAGSRVPIGTRQGSPNDPNYQNFNVMAWYRIATGSGTYSFSATMENECMGAVLHLRGATGLDDGVSELAVRQEPPTVAAGQEIPGVTPLNADSLLVGVWGGIQFSGTIAYTAPASMVARAQPRTNQYVSTFVATQQLSSAGATGSRTATSSPTAAYGWAGKMFAVSGVQAATGPEPGRFMISGV